MRNKLVLNRDKTKFLVISRNKTTKETPQLEARPINIKPISSFKFLGMQVSDDLKWNKFLLEGNTSLLAQLKKCTVALGKIRHFSKNNQFRKFSNGLFMSKLLYGAELWTGAPAYMTKQIQSQIIKVAHMSLGCHSLRFNTDKLMRLMGWHNINQTLSIASMRFTHQIVNLKIPELLSQKFDNLPPDENGKLKKNLPILEELWSPAPISDTTLTKITSIYLTG